ncbi:hypothetical protein SMKI_13G2470 [Saccharomyces mikatae IFO 1815]|uniref:Uncharacterized protein n=1 Tax=Saccharomyces mikatae IFO 1815 TaxID=226126 RepID=A0AA35NDJ2_SACMI|nr:uncharacterized protein SMKI_13G2470 [Saccharomyces mikatae IFO 1815]CAI4035597.1 hypothetical protein SMKI_13G2470 [Saccharomyces mikatae IFO 1815]
MDAGLSTMAPRNGQSSARVKLRNNLLNSDIGDIDIRDESPISKSDNDRNNNNQPFSMSLQQQQQYYGNDINEVPMQMPLQQRQIPIQMYSQQQRQQQQYNLGYSNPPLNGIPVSQHNFTKPSPSSNHNGVNSKKASSLTQSSFSNFFKHKHQFGKSKKNAKGVGDGDDDEEVILEDSANADLTFNDIQTLGHKGGDKYGYGGDSAPIIPTLVTRDRGTMSNTEYRKYMTNQKKTAMNAMAKQTKNGGAVSLPPRAMSLQSFPNGNPLMQAPAPHPNFPPNNMVGPNYSRANSLMTGPPRQFQQPQQQQRMPPINYYNNRPGQFQNTTQPVIRTGQQQPQQPQQPRTMSLTNAPRYSPQNPTPFVLQQQLSQRQQQPQQMSENYRTMSLQTQNVPQGFQQWTSSDNNARAVPIRKPADQSPISSRNNSAHSIPIPSIQNKSSSTFSSSTSSIDATAIPDLKKQRSSPLKKQINNNQTIVEKGKLNVLQLSAPQQKELKEKETKLAEMEKSLREREMLIEEKERARKNDETSGAYEASHNSDDLNLRPTSALETGLGDLTLDGEGVAANRASLVTFSSTFSDSPSKQRIINTRTGMYKLENSTDINEYVTAQEFPSPEQHSANVDNDEANAINGAESNNSNSKRASFLHSIPERDPKRNISDSTIRRRQSDDNDKRISNVNISMNQENINNDTFLYKKNNRDGHLSAASYMSSSSRKSLISNTLPLNIDSTSESDNFIPHMDCSPSKREVSTANHGKGDTNVSEEDFSFDNTLAKTYEPLYTKRGDLTHAISTDGEKGSESKMITISGEQLNLITENKELMNELTLVSTELAESIKRETELEERIRLYETDNSTPNFDNSSSVSFSDFEKELRKKSSKIVQLIQQLNEERLKRFIAEEQLLLQENGTKPSSIELVGRIENLNKLIDERDSEIEMLKDHLQ